MRSEPSSTRLGGKVERIFPFRDAANVLDSELDVEHLLHVLVENATKLLNADRSTLFVLDHTTGELWSKIAQGVRFREIRVPVSEGVAGYVATSGETVNITDAYSDPRFKREVDLNTGYTTKSILCMPMVDADGDIVGVIEVLNKRNGHFTQEDEEILANLCSKATVLICTLALYSTWP
jgi:GAF domain-containing protein